MAISILRLALLPGLLMLIGCVSGPTPRTYVLGVQKNPIAGVTSESGRPVVELKPVSVPDYLDTTDILLRDGGNELKASLTGRWGERLSVGVTRALGEALTKRLPTIVVDRGTAVRQPARTLLIDIEAFDVMPDARCVLTARWTILGADKQNLRASERATVITMVPRTSGGPTDAAIVVSMAAAVDQLADHIVTGLSRTLNISAH